MAKINDDHLYHGAALAQLAEHDKFTAINAFKINDGISRSAFKINKKVGVFLKYASKPKGTYEEYQFTFTHSQLAELELIEAETKKLFIALVCVKDRQICCISFDELQHLICLRQDSAETEEDTYQILVTAYSGYRFRVYVNVAGKKGKMMGEMVVAKNSFPDRIFCK